MNANMSPEVLKIRDLDHNLLKLLDEGKFSEGVDACHEILKLLETLPEADKEANKEFFVELADDVRDRLVLCKFKLEDYDSAIEEGLTALEIKESYGIHSRIGICYFKKGKYYKARDHLNKAKSLNPGMEDKIVDNYIKQTLEMIADIES